MGILKHRPAVLVTAGNWLGRADADQFFELNPLVQSAAAQLYSPHGSAITAWCVRVLAASAAVPRGVGKVSRLPADHVGDRNFGGLDKLDGVAPRDVYGDDGRDWIVVGFWRLALGVDIDFYRMGGALSRH